MKTNLITQFLCSLLVVVMLFSGVVLADDKKRRKPPGIQAPSSSKLAPSSQPRISNSRAASLVKKSYGNARILGVSLLERGDSPVYKVRTLSQDGVVKSVFVDGSTGEVFE